MFPAEWTRAQTIEKIYESMRNTVEIFYEKGTRYQHLGLTSEGIPVLSVIETKDNIAKMITAYPDFDTYRKLLEGNAI